MTRPPSALDVVKLRKTRNSECMGGGNLEPVKLFFWKNFETVKTSSGNFIWSSDDTESRFEHLNLLLAKEVLSNWILGLKFIKLKSRVEGQLETRSNSLPWNMHQWQQESFWTEKKTPHKMVQYRSRRKQDIHFPHKNV